jgi:hypothetical protein
MRFDGTVITPETPQEVVEHARMTYERSRSPVWPRSVRDAAAHRAARLFDAIDFYDCIRGGDIHYSSAWDDLRDERAWPEPVPEALRRAAEVVRLRLDELTDLFPACEVTKGLRAA